MKIIGIIPARGGSKGIPRKNIKEIAGKPLIYWTIKSAKESKLMTDFYVSTEDKEIAEISKSFGAKVIDRPPELATDTANGLDVIKHAISVTKADVVVILQPTSPVREKGLIDKCIKNFLDTKADNLATGYICNLFEYGKYSSNRQELKGFFHDDGNVYVIKSELVMQGKRTGDNSQMLEINREQNFEIDNEFDFWLNEQILLKREKEIIEINNKIISDHSPVFFIAEAGVNHNGDLTLAKKLVDIAVESKADAVKFQTYKTEDLVTKNAVKSEYQGKGKQFETLKKLELNENEFVELKKYCDEKEIIFLSTPHTLDSVDLLENLVPAYKIASGDLTNFPLLKKVAEKKKPIILSSGMATIEEIGESLDFIKKINPKIILLHCTTSYPCEKKDVNLKVIETLRNKFGFLTGYSDHTKGIEVSLMAAKLGARVIEKHFTLNNNLEGPDHKASLNPSELKELIFKLRNKEEIKLDKVILGTGIKKPTENELKIMPTSRKSLVSNSFLKKGEVIKRDFITIKRPGTGISPKYFDVLIGKKAKKDIDKDEILTFDKIDWETQDENN
jgi:N-acetylneuraminate synthase/N,N'-diacetyllegionaminate synthase